MRNTAASTSALLLLVMSGLSGADSGPTFTRTDYASRPGARAIVVDDFNRDGWPDVAEASLDTSGVTVLLNGGGERMTAAPRIATGAGPFDLASGDLNRDGIPDLVVANADANSLSVLAGTGDGRFTRTDIPTAPAAGPRGVAIADLDANGTLDVIFTAYDSATIGVLLGDGAGGFAAGPRLASAPRPQGVTAADINRDGRLDLVVAHHASPGLSIWFATSGGFTQAIVPGASYLNVLAAADLNDDGHLDIAAASTDYGRVAVFLGGSMQLAFSRSYAVDPDPRGLAIADVSGDGLLDVITANRGTSTISILRGDAAHRGALLPRLTVAAGFGSRAIAAGDFNRDGRVDLAAGNQYANALTLLSNDTPLQDAGYAFAGAVLPAGVELESRRYVNEGPTFRAADFNRDGSVDFVQRVAGSNDAAVIITGGATIVLPGAAPDVSPHPGYLVGDFNGDANPDVVVDAGSELRGYLGDGRGRFSAALVSPIEVEQCASGDLDRDGRLDLACSGKVLLGNGNGTFREGATLFAENSPWGVPVIVDANRDGRPDIVDASAALWHGDGRGGFVYVGRVDPATGHSAVLTADLNHDGYADLVFSDGNTTLWLTLGGPGGFTDVTPFYGEGLEASTDFAIADVNADGHPDVLINYLNEDADTAGVLRVVPGLGDGTFGTPEPFAAPGGELLAIDVTHDRLLDLVVARGRQIHVRVNQRGDTNHAPLVAVRDITVSYTGGDAEARCFDLPVSAVDPDYHALWVQWSVEGPAPGGGPNPSGSMGQLTAAATCIEGPGVYEYMLTVSDSRGAEVARTLTVTVTGPGEVVLWADNPMMVAGTSSIVSDSSAAGGVKAYIPNAGAPKVTSPQASPADFVEFGFTADPDRAYKLWLRLRADGNDWANDSVWVQFSGATDAGGTPRYGIGTTSGLAVSLEECLHCGVSGWGWEDDGWGAVDANGVLLRFPSGGHQRIRIQTREDGVSIDQIVLSSETYLTRRPGTAKNDTTILPKTK